MLCQLAEIELIANNSEAPTFANTIEAMERSGRTAPARATRFRRHGFIEYQPNASEGADRGSAEVFSTSRRYLSQPEAIRTRETFYDQRKSLRLAPNAEFLVLP